MDTSTPTNGLSFLPLKKACVSTFLNKPVHDFDWCGLKFCSIRYAKNLAILSQVPCLSENSLDPSSESHLLPWQDGFVLKGSGPRRQWLAGPGAERKERCSWSQQPHDCKSQFLPKSQILCPNSKALDEKLWH